MKTMLLLLVLGSAHNYTPIQKVGCMCTTTNGVVVCTGDCGGNGICTTYKGVVTCQ